MSTKMNSSSKIYCSSSSSELEELENIPMTPTRSHCIECQHVFDTQAMGRKKQNHALKNPGSSKVKDKEKSDLFKIQETLKTARKTSDQAIQQSFSIIERHRLETKEISNTAYNYFKETHKLLHIIERDIQSDITKGRESLLNKTKKILTTLKAGRNQINEKINEINSYIHSDGTKSKTISEITQETNTFLENVNCSAKFIGNDRKLFIAPFSSFDTHIDGIRSFKIDFNDDFYQPATCPYISKPLNINGSKNVAIKSRTPQPPQSPSTNDPSPKIQKRPSPQTKKSVFQKKISFVSYVASPSHFYIRTEAFVNSFQSLRDKCREEGNKSHAPEKFELGEIYLIKEKNVRVKNGVSGYRRGRLDFKKNDLTYNVFYIDYGNFEEVSTDRIRKILSSELAEKAENIILCSLYDIKPIGDKWKTEATYHMKDIIASGSNVFVVFLDHDDKKQVVDLIKSEKNCHISVRDALIFAGFGRKPEDDFTSKSIHEYQNRKNMIYKASVDNEKIFSNHFQIHSCFGIKMRHIVDPNEFYVTKLNLLDQINANTAQLNTLYNVSYSPLYLPHQNQNCAARSKELKIWVRGRITSISPSGKCMVFFNDYGITEELSWDQLAVLDDQFKRASDGVFKCSLLDVVPLAENYYKWTDEGINDFRRYTSSAASLTISIGPLYNGTYTTVLFHNKKDRSICINAKLVDSNHCSSSGPESTRIEWLKSTGEIFGEANDDLKVEEVVEPSEEKKTACHVQIMNIISPEHFYVSLCKHLPKIQSLHETIQLKMIDCEPIEKNCVWTVQERCFVLTNQNIYANCEEWYRGIVTDISDENIKVFLRDKGVSIKVSKNKLAKINDEIKSLDDIIDGVFECHLACLRPTGGSHSKWTSSATDAFKDIVETYEEITIQTYQLGAQKHLRSISVLLYGLTYVSKAFSTHVKLENVNQYLATIGLSSVVVKIPPHQLENKNSFEFDEMILEKIVPPKKSAEYTSISEISTGNYDFSNYSVPVDKWQPANNVNKRNFTAKALNVDVNAGVYFRDSEIEPVAKEVNHRLEERFKYSKNSLNDAIWKVGQACICKYHLDRNFYRAEILQIDRETCKVRFIDYGNIEEVNKIDLRSEIICGSIPILVNRYIIADMVPSSVNGKWSRSVLDRIHALIVGKLCDVVIVKNAINKCHVSVNGVRLVDLLVTEGLVRRGDTSMIKKYDELFEFTDRTDLEESFVARNVTISETVEVGDDFLPGIPKREQEDYAKLFANSMDVTLEDFKEDEEDLNKSLFNFELAHTINNTSLASSVFCPKNTSSKKGSKATSADTTIDKDEMFTELKVTEKSFYCNVMAITSVHTIYIHPRIESHLALMNEMDLTMQELGNIADRVEENQIEVGNCYLVKYKKDDKWYRAQVQKIYFEVKKAEILYIDYLNTEIVTLDQIYEYPKNLGSYNLMNITASLHGVEYNPNVKPESVYNKLAELLEGKTIYAKIIENCYGKLPKVDLYEKKNSRSVIYKSLIDNELLLVSS